MTTEIELTHDDSYWTRVAGRVLDSYHGGVNSQSEAEARDLGRRIRQAVTDIGREDIDKVKESLSNGVSAQLGERGSYFRRHYGYYYW